MPRQSVLYPLFPYNTERLRHENEKCVKLYLIYSISCIDALFFVPLGDKKDCSMP